jgi:hypothetical protein
MHDVTGIASKHKWTADELAQRFQIIERRQELKRRARRAQKKRSFNWEWQRWRELCVIFEKRHGWLIERSDVADLLHAKAPVATSFS